MYETEIPKCYICKYPIISAHNHYTAMCIECGEFNFNKRELNVNLNGMVALVTGCRIKIGFEITKKLLRSGAYVFGTTRFSGNAYKKFEAETDFDEWKDRLCIFQLDLLSPSMVIDFIREFSVKTSRLDIIINNAAQTIRRPFMYYRNLLEEPVYSVQSLLTQDISTQLEQKVAQFDNKSYMATNSKKIIYGYPNLYQGDDDINNFPDGLVDVDGEPLDLRSKNSWTRKMGDIDPIEVLEVQLVNLISPFILINGFLPIMKQSTSDRRYIVNVSSMEGVFSKKNKNVYHPHTNIAKAGLHMLTRTIAKDLWQNNIFVTAVDTGWITNENPVPLRGKRRSTSIQPPLDSVDGAARVLDPIFMGEMSKKPQYGILLKNYKRCSW
ncbi:MAG: SDR family oxidoreductase [Methylococcales bacterium]